MFAAFAAFAAAGCLFAFVGLARSGYWTDELFSLFVIGHRGGLAEVLRRALTDTHPPGYYFLLYEWARLFGLSETALRLSSAICAVAAAGVFYFGLRGVFSPVARAFALAVALNASCWFDRAQNVRSYSLCMLISALLLVLALAARRGVRAGARFPAGPCAGLMLAGFVGSFCHAYLFLEVGLVYLFLVLTLPSLGLRVALTAWGLVIAALDGVYVRALLHATRQDIHHMWFRSDALFFFDQITVAYRITFGFAGVAAVGLRAVSAWRRGRAARGVAPVEAERCWIAGLSAFGHLGMIVLGVAVSLALAPSMSSLNLASAAPLLWALAAWLYDLGGPRADSLASRALAAVLGLAAAAHLPILAGRFITRTEDWRGSARYVAGLAACARQPIPIVPPQRFGPDTPFFRTLAERSFYGRYFPEPGRLHAYTADELAGRRPVAGLGPLLAARARDPRGCPVLAWGVHDLTPAEAVALGEALQRRPGVLPAQVAVKRFDHYEHQEIGYRRTPGAFVYLAVRPAGPAQATPTLTPRSPR
jgi:hypothetical protein